MSGLFGRLITHFINEVVVKALANSRTFQRFALRTDSAIQQKKQAAVVIKNEAVKKGEEALKTHAENKTLEFGGIDFGKFLHDFKEEIRAGSDPKPKAPPKK